MDVMAMNCGVCGALCEKCPFFKETCAGCIECAGKVFWAVEHFGGSCPLYACAVTERGYKSCGECAELPCRLFFEMKDPSMTDEEHKKSIDERVNILKNKN